MSQSKGPSKLKLWQEHTSWEDAEAAWQKSSALAEQSDPIKRLDKLPNIPGITPDTAKNLKWKSLRWMLSQDHTGEVRKGFLKHPFKYGWRFLCSLLKRHSYNREEDFFLYGVKTVDEFKEWITKENTVFVVGFSYCHKPLECPSGRFTDACGHDLDNSVCRQCFIGKMMHAMPEKGTVPLIIPTIHYIGGKIFEAVHSNPGKQVIFLITACEMTLQMFGDWGNMAGIKGIGVRLDGRICNTMKAFELSERGVKPGLTVVLESTQQKMLELIRIRSRHFPDNT